MKPIVTSILAVTATILSAPYAVSFSPSTSSASVVARRPAAGGSLSSLGVIPDGAGGANNFLSVRRTTAANIRSITSLSLFSREHSKSVDRNMSPFLSNTIKGNKRKEENLPAAALNAMSKNKLLGSEKNNAVLVVPGIGPEGCALPSPSRVNTLPEPIQAIIVFAIFATLGVSSVAFSSFLDDITLKYEWVQTWRYTWPLLGVIYMAAGVTHFTLESEYINIYPKKGAWGFWYLPGSPKFHVQWTGIAEILGGLGLLIGGAYDAFMPVWGECPNVLTSAGIGSDAAAGLLLLTVAVTPANVYMYTHGAKLPMDGQDVPVLGHLIRGIMQVVLFGLLYQMGQGSFDAVL